jgi:hypothetical protein
MSQVPGHALVNELGHRAALIGDGRGAARHRSTTDKPNGSSKWTGCSSAAASPRTSARRRDPTEPATASSSEPRAASGWGGTFLAREAAAAGPAPGLTSAQLTPTSPSPPRPTEPLPEPASPPAADSQETSNVFLELVVVFRAQTLELDRIPAAAQDGRRLLCTSCSASRRSRTATASALRRSPHQRSSPASIPRSAPPPTTATESGGISA